MMNETLLYGIMISMVLGLGIFYVCWRYLPVVPYSVYELFIKKTGDTMTNIINFNSNDVIYFNTANTLMTPTTTDRI